MALRLTNIFQDYEILEVYLINILLFEQSLSKVYLYFFMWYNPTFPSEMDKLYP
jgi:hypothetical protein